MRIGLEMLSDTSHEPCDRCKSTSWARIGLTLTPNLRDVGAVEFPKFKDAGMGSLGQVRAIICIDCLAYAIQAVTGWNIRGLINRYKEVSPLYGTVPVEPPQTVIEDFPNQADKTYQPERPKSKRVNSKTPRKIN